MPGFPNWLKYLAGSDQRMYFLFALNNLSIAISEIHILYFCLSIVQARSVAIEKLKIEEKLAPQTGNKPSLSKIIINGISISKLRTTPKIVLIYTNKSGI